MSVKNTVFFLDLRTLEQKGDDNLKRFAAQEELEVEDIVKIIYHEAGRIGEEEKVKVTFKIEEDDEDSFRIIVEPETMKYKGTVIYPFKGVESSDFKLDLDDVFGKLTLVNKKDENKKISVTIDGISLDIFAMVYKRAKEFLKDISNRKEKGSYVETEDSIAFKYYGIKVTCRKDENGNVLENELIESIEVYNESEFFKEFTFEELSNDEHYDVNIPLPDEYNYEKKELTKKKKVIIPEDMEETTEKIVEEVPEVQEVAKDEIQIDIPQEELEKDEKRSQERIKEAARVEEERQRQEEEAKAEETEPEGQEVEEEATPVKEIEVVNDLQAQYEIPIPQVAPVDDKQAELDRIREKQEAELERVKEKLRRELEEQLNRSMNKYNVDEEVKAEETVEPEVQVEEQTVEEKVKKIKKEYNIEDVISKYDKANKERLEKELKQVENVENLEEKEEEVIEEEIQEEEPKIQEELAVEPEEAIEEVEEKTPEDKEVNEAVEVEESTETEEENEFEEQQEPETVEKEKVEEETPQSNASQELVMEIQKMLMDERKRQEQFENRIAEMLTMLQKPKAPKAEVEEVKEEKTEVKDETEKVEVKNIDEPVQVKVPVNVVSYDIETYKGIKEQGKDELAVYFGQDKADVRKYFGGSPKEIRDYDEMEIYDIFYAYYDDKDKCTGIGIYNQEVYKDKVALYMFGKNLITMTYREIVRLIKKHDLNAIEDDDGIISLKYGISVDPRETPNFKDEISDVIHIFKKGYYDEVYENY